MLQGTLDVFSLDEVLGLLSGANKSGVLNITGDRGIGSVSIADGQLVAGSASSAPEAAWLSDVVFELLRYEEGSFSFDGAAAVEGDPQELAAIMAEAHSRFDEWKGIEAIVPSLDHHVSLTTSLSTTQVTLSESEWAAIVAVGEGASVGVIARRLGLGEFDGSKRVKSLVERSLASLEDVAQQTATAPASAVELDDAPVVSAPVFATPEPAPMSFADVSAPAADELIDQVQTPEPVAVEPVAVEPAAVEPAAVEPVATGFSFEAVAPDAPAFDDLAAELFEAEAEIPPMPEAPSFGSFADADPVDSEIPPMPEPPSTFADRVSEPPAPEPPFAGDVFDAPQHAAPDVTPSTFGGLDPIGAADMFEPPRRAGERSTDGFAGDSFDAAGITMDTEMEAPMPPPPAPVDAVPSQAGPTADGGMPSFAAPAAFDADAFGVSDDEPITETDEAADDAGSEQDKGGSLLMRYLKSNG